MTRPDPTAGRYSTLIFSVLALALAPARSATFNIAAGDVAALLDAIETSNTNNENDTINLAAGSTYTVAVEDHTDPNYGADAFPIILPDNGHNLIISGDVGTVITRPSNAPNFRFFRLAPGAAVILDHVALIGGVAVESSGGAIYVRNASLDVRYCTFSNNQLSLTQRTGAGAAIYMDTTLHVQGTTPSVSITASTFTQNDSDTGAGAIGSSGSEGNVDVQNCTFVDNNEDISNTVPLTVSSCTFVIDGTSIENHSTAHLANSIFYERSPLAADHSASIITAPGTGITSEGYNLTNDPASAQYLVGPSDQTNVDPKLDPSGLQDNGGPTQTVALTAQSPARDKGFRFGLTTDQRGTARPVDSSNVPNAANGDGSDIGAYEAPLDPVQFGDPSYVVTTTGDHDDGVCGGTDCTLREAIARANAVPFRVGSNTITFAPGLNGTITLSDPGGELLVTGDLRINGPGARVLAVSGNSAHRVFHIQQFAQITGLTIRDGLVPGQNAKGTARFGGGIYSENFLTLIDCALTNNKVTGDNNTTTAGTGGAARGGAVYAVRRLGVTGCTLSGNSATGGAGGPNSGTSSVGGTGGVAEGGGIYYTRGGFASEVLYVANCTLTNNMARGGVGGADTDARGGNGGNANGGAIAGDDTAVYLATISGNAASGGNGGASKFGTRPSSGTGSGGGMAVSGGTAHVGNTIIAQNTASTGGGTDVNGAFTSDGYNLIGAGDPSSGFTAATDLVGTTASPIHPHLAALQNNGGPTDTMMLLFGSPAIDAGFTNALTDQRGMPRPVDVIFPNAPPPDGSTNNTGAASDIGAVEVNLLAGPDSDTDGMSDDFEKFFGLNPMSPTDAASDSDGDGLTNLEEFRAGTNPLDATSRLRITNIARSGNNVVVSFAPVIVAKKYRLQRKDVLNNDPANTWQSISGVADFIASSNGPGQITDPNGGAITSRYYRIQLVP